MKIDRLLGILNILTRTQTVTAPELAERFEVSRRTINRDIEDLCMAGIPIVTKQGAGGGISILEEYKLDRSLLKGRELTDLVAALKGMESVNASDNIRVLLNKIVSEEFREKDSNIIQIDLASFYKDSLSDKIGKIKEAIEQHRLIEFTYYSVRGESLRRVEPCRIIFKWSDWYMKGYCLERDAFRMFKLNRLWNLYVSEERYEKREIPDEESASHDHLTDEHSFSAVFDSCVKYRLVEEYGPGSFVDDGNGAIIFHGKYTNQEYILSWLLSFGSRVKVTAPDTLAEDVRRQAEEVAKKYGNEKIT